jgi:hypothetical protein
MVAHLIPTEESVAALARRLTTENSEATPRKLDKTYVREWKKYTQWVEINRANFIIPAGDKFITRVNIDLYFSHVVAHRHDVLPTTARRALCALQVYADDVEYIDGSEKMELESVSVKKALEAQKRRHYEHMSDKIVDPHANLPTNVLTEAETVEVITECVKSPNWRDLCLSWTTCEQTFIRNHSIRQLTLSDLCHNRTHGPSTEEGNIDSQMMSYILQKGVHKERATIKRIAGAWRHKFYLRCAVGHLAMNMMCRLHSDVDLHFFKHLNGPKKGTSDWMKEPLIQGWKDEKAAQKAYSTVLDRVGVSWAKVTHLRKAGMEYASARGELGEKAIESMSKHQTEKLGKVYMTELYGPVMRVMSGHPKGDPV